MNKILKKIIYIEDDADISEIAAMALQSIGGFEVECFLSAKKALENLEKSAPQLILLDMMMPEMDGLTFFDKMRQMPQFKDVPVIFMTAKVQNEEVKSYLDKGALGVIPKPFDPMQLCNLINDYWGKFCEGK